MKKTFVPVLVTLLFFCSTAFGAGVHGRLNGKWACDGAASAKLMDGQFANTQERQSVAEVLGGMTIAFNTTLKTMKVALGFKTQDSKYAVVSESDKGLTLQRASDGATLAVEFKGADSFVLRDGKMSMVFKRAK